MTLTKKQIKHIQTAFRGLAIISVAVLWGVAAAVDHDYISDGQFIAGAIISLACFAIGLVFGGVIRR